MATLIIVTAALILFYIVIVLIFKPDVSQNDAHNNLRFEKIKLLGGFIKWVIASVIIYSSVQYVNDTFKNREVGIEEMKQYDTYVNTVLGKDINTKKAYALYYSIITPDSILRTRWKVYLDTLNSRTTVIQSINDQLKDSSITPNKRIQLLKQRDSINTSLQTQQQVSKVSDAESTLYRIDITFKNIADYPTSQVTFELFGDGYAVFSKSFNQSDFVQFAMQGSHTYTMFYTETKNELTSQALNFEILGDPGSKPVRIYCDVKFYFYNGKPVSEIKNIDIMVTPGINNLGPYIPLWNKEL